MTSLIDAAPAPDRLLADRLAATARIDPSDLKRVERLCEERDERLAPMLSRLGLVSERELAAALAEALDLRLVSAAELPREALRVEGLPARFLREVRVLPLAARPDGLAIAMADPTDDYALSALRMVVGDLAEVAVAEAGAVEAAIERLYAEAGLAEGAGVEASPVGALETEVERLRDQASEAPVIRLVNTLVTAAVDARASDIHIEPGEREHRVRFRVDGLLTTRDPLPLHLAPAVVSRVKIMARLDIAERRRPQDGRIRTAVRGRTIDLRVSIVPVMHGESVVIRVLDREGVALEFEALGIPADARAALDEILARPRGVLLITGPTGSGKTTTLYTALKSVNQPEWKILTVEDPVEYQIEGVNQVQVHAAIGLSFAGILRSLLRHDPDVMMVGEIRDGETAQIATQAALTGHLVISTLHTNDAPSAVTRLMDMGVEPFLIASTLTGIGAQRLVRRLCPACRTADPAPARVVEEFGLPPGPDGGPPRLWRAVGCETCRGRGFQGRSAIFEMLVVTPEIRELILEAPGAAELRRAAEVAGMRGMMRDGIEKALAGVTTLEEVLRSTRGA